MNNTTTGSLSNSVTIYPSNLIPNGSWFIGNTYPSTGTITSSSSNITFGPEIKIKRCRMCNHAHLQGQEGCMEVVGLSAAFVPLCICKEYLPSDNLEYLEYMFDKKQK